MIWLSLMDVAKRPLVGLEMRWTQATILAELRQRSRKGATLSHRALREKNRPLANAAAYHFGSYAAALEAAGIPAASVRKRPLWTKDRIIKAIKAARKAKRDLCWSCVVKRGGPLSRAAFAAIRPTMFGSWARALQVAGVDADDYRRYRAWDRESVAFDLKQRYADDEGVNCGAVQSEDPGLYAAAIRYFGSFDRALKAARLMPGKVRVRKPRRASGSLGGSSGSGKKT